MQKPTILYGEEKPSYYVMAAGGQAPTREHHSRISARNEANRLAKANPGTKFSVVKLKDAVIFDPAGAAPTNEADLEKQVFARALLGVGKPVQVKKSHHEFANRRGIVTRLGNLADNDSSVYVILEGDIEERRFSATSLRRAARSTADQQEEPKADDSTEGPPLRDILLDLLVSAAMNQITKVFEGEEDVPGGLHDERKQHMARVAAIPPGTEVVAIMERARLGGLLPARVVKARLLGPSPDTMMVRLDFTESRGPADETVNVSRVYLLDDPELELACNGVL